ncbi:hypothetical protein [Bradyrhizobium barranii]|uniref:hypothetical protein n=1 Tax=Bradyrhizobium TaxID=374 RepID=UPI0024B260B9|nr:hypothetical protein [Bradyrhizobium barranii]WFT95232.1 hypothetical protein QA633_44535 [Bradyrhizobium barranii]
MTSSMIRRTVAAARRADIGADDRFEHTVHKPDLRGKLPESWACIDCGVNTAPGFFNREQMEQAMALDWNDQGVKQTVDASSEVYTVKPKIWKAAGMEEMSGCLCIGCLERRIGRMLAAEDFPRNDPFNAMPGTERLRSRRWRRGQRPKGLRP